VLFSLFRSVQFFKLSLELVNKHVEVVEKSLSLRGLFTRLVYREVVDCLCMRFILASGYSV